jgi:hypothetical protein
MVERQESQSAIQPILFALLCLMVIIAGGVFVLDQGRVPYHTSSVPKLAVVTQTPLPATLPQPSMIASKPVKRTPASRLHSLSADPDADISGLVSFVVGAFDDISTGHALESYLLWAIGTKKSDAYIDSLLNSAAAKGHFQIPLALTTLSGRLDTESLLKSVLIAAKQVEPAQQPPAFPSQQHLLRLSDSLIGLSLTYYGDPLDHMRIADANGSIAQMAEAQVGQIVEIPGL